jgi:hypothetical protein
MKHFFQLAAKGLSKRSSLAPRASACRLSFTVRTTDEDNWLLTFVLINFILVGMTYDI